jgi:RNA polymerase sigma-70 factor, ECF subfamily
MSLVKSPEPLPCAPGAEGQSLRCIPGGLKRESFDAAYVQRLIEGDPATERHFFQYFSEILWIKLRSRLRDTGLVEDLRQETLLRVITALKSKNSLQVPEKLGAFVNAVCNNLLFERYRSESRRKAVEIPDGFDRADGRSSVESELVTEERRREVRQVLDELPPKDRELLRLVFYEDIDRNEICKSYQVEREYLRVLLHRAKMRFREGLLRRRSTQETI